MNERIPFGDCRNENLVIAIFGSVSEFARLCEAEGDNFQYGNVDIVYDEDRDIHYFY